VISAVRINFATRRVYLLCMDIVKEIKVSEIRCESISIPYALQSWVKIPGPAKMSRTGHEKSKSA